MFGVRHIVIGSVAGLALLALGLFLASPASAAINMTGDWVIGDSQSYLDEVITIASNNSTNGNVIILSTGDLHLENCTLIIANNRSLDNGGYLEVRNSTIRSNNWFFWLRAPADLVNVVLGNATHDTFALGHSGTFVQDPSVTFTNVSWTRAGFRGPGIPSTSVIHMRVASNFIGNFLGAGGELRYELPPLSGTVSVEVANNRFALSAGMASRTTGLYIDNVQHSGAVTYDIHNNVFSDGDDGIYVGASSTSTQYLIHDNTFFASGSVALEFGQPTVGSRFSGVALLSNLTILNVTTIFGNRYAIRMYGDASRPVVGEIDNVTIANCGNGIVANEGTWIVTNSAITNTTPQYIAEANGHIKIYTTVDTALDGDASGASGSIEHFAFFNLATLSWQGAVPILGDKVDFRNGTGLTWLSINATSWAPSDVVWWGLYTAAPSVDNRDLHPVIADGGRVFACVPVQFFLMVPMAPIAVTCTDDEAPSLSIGLPPPVWSQNTSALVANGSVGDRGSGLAGVDWSFDNASWTPAAFNEGAQTWQVTLPTVADGSYTFYLKAADRVGSATYASRGPFLVDTRAPSIVLPAVPTYAAGTYFTLAGTTEPFATISWVTANGTTGAPFQASTDGSFSIDVPLVEGLLTFWVTATDAARNSYRVQVSLLVDNVAPSISVFLITPSYTALQNLTVEGLTDTDATVKVNGQVTTRTGAGFSAMVGLTPGRNVITVNATDPAGNTARWYGVVWYDNEPPVLNASVSTVDKTPEGLPLTRSSNVAVSGSATDALSGIASFSISGIQFALGAAGSIDLAFNVSDGSNRLDIVAIDRVGNAANITLYVVRDNVPPALTATLLPGDDILTLLGGSYYTRGSNVVVSVDVSEDSVATVQGTAHPVSAGPNLFTVSIVEGTNNLIVSCRDLAGNPAAPVSLAITRDTTPPSIVISSPVNGSAVAEDSIQVAGLAEPGSTVLVNGHPVQVSASGGFTGSVAVVEGSNTIRVAAADGLGNSNTTSITVSRRAAPVSTVEGLGPGSVLFVVLGAAVGFVAAALLMRGRRGGGEPQLAGASGDAGQAGGSASREPRQKGPRGPHPPSG